MATNINFTTMRGSYAYNTGDYITRGGQASLYLGRNITTNQQVVIRLIDLQQYDNENATIWFQREKDLEKLRHTNIVKVLDFHETTDDHGKARGIIIQEYIKGKTLFAKTEEWEHSPLSERDINEAKFQVMIDALSGLDYLHRNNIIHRDISPNNIMIAENGQVKIIDFGLAKDITDTTRSYTRVVPSFVYSPLEMGNTDPAPTIDVYSIAIVFYEMLSGIHFYSKNSIPTVIQPRHQEFIGKLEKHKRIHPKLLSVLQKASSVNKELRYKSASEFQQALLSIRDVVLKVNKEPMQGVKKKFSFSALQPKHFIIGAIAVAVFIVGAISLFYKNSDDKDPSKNEFASTADNGYKEAVEGEKYKHGLGVSLDHYKAAEFWRIAAAKNHPIGMYHLATDALFRKIDIDSVEENRLLRQGVDGIVLLANSGDAVAQNNLGTIYECGHIFKRNDSLAFHWRQKAAKQGWAIAQMDLAIMYQYGHGVEIDDIKGTEWLEKSAKQNCTEAQLYLGGRYAFGINGVKQNNSLAMFWFHKAAALGWQIAQWNLGEIYYEGKITTQNDAEAVKWLQKASSQGNTFAKAMLDSINRKNGNY